MIAIDKKPIENLRKEIAEITAKLTEEMRKIHPGVTKALSIGANDIRNDMLRSIMGKHKGDKVYEWRGAIKDEEADLFIRSPQGHIFPAKWRDKPHTASAPGEAPATDTGELARSIYWNVEGDMVVNVGTLAGAYYAKWLEEGTKYMKARPFLGPAAEKNMESIIERVKKAAISGPVNESFKK